MGRGGALVIGKGKGVVNTEAGTEERKDTEGLVEGGLGNGAGRG